jgi:hypothetical protein
MKLSILVPAYRTERWAKLYEDIGKAFSNSWELVLVSEKELPEDLKDKTNIKLIYSNRSPMGKQQQGIEHCSGEWIITSSDDYQWLPGMLDKAFEFFGDADYKTVLVMKYLEGKEFDFPQWYLDQVPEDMRFKTNYDFMRSNKYYYSCTHESSAMPGIPRKSPILSCAAISRKLLLEMGGWDASFQSQAMGNVDLGARMMLYGCKYEIFPDVVAQVGYMEEATGDHGNIHYAQIEDDQPILNERYKEPANPLCIPLDNWKGTPEVWKRKIKGIDAPDLTVIVPGIRVKNWKRLYDSVSAAFSGTWEIIFISPYTLPKELVLLPNVRLIGSHRSPIACQQQGLLASKGRYITWAADDGWYLPNSLDKSFDLLKEKNYKTIVMGKYQEGDRVSDVMEKIDYYILTNHETMRLPFVPRGTYMLNCGVVSRKLLIELGGWDAENFEVCPLSYNDFAIRSQKYGCEYIIQEETMFGCTHFPGEMEDHGPVHRAQVLHDHPIFEQIYTNTLSQNRIAVNLNGWKNAPEKWARRFGGVI